MDAVKCTDLKCAALSCTCVSPMAPSSRYRHCHVPTFLCCIVPYTYIKDSEIEKELRKILPFNHIMLVYFFSTGQQRE